MTHPLRAREGCKRGEDEDHVAQPEQIVGAGHAAAIYVSVALHRACPMHSPHAEAVRAESDKVCQQEGAQPLRQRRARHPERHAHDMSFDGTRHARLSHARVTRTATQVACCCMPAPRTPKDKTQRRQLTPTKTDRVRPANWWRCFGGTAGQSTLEALGRGSTR